MLALPHPKAASLYDRIIKASSNEGDIVLDPFAGCGTTIEAALTNNRRVIGIDILPFALRLINQYKVRRSEYLPRQGVPQENPWIRKWSWILVNRSRRANEKNNALSVRNTPYPPNTTSIIPLDKL